MRRATRWIAAILLAGGLSAGGPARAAEGRIPIFEATTISKPGKYIVTRNITTSSGSAAIYVFGSAGSVDVDLNGFTVTSTAAGAWVIRGAFLENLTVRNGTIVGTPTTGGILTQNCELSAVEDVTIENTDVGIQLLDTRQYLVRGNTISTTVSHGVLVNQSGDPANRSGCVIKRNVAVDSGSMGMNISLGGSLVEGNVVNGSAGWGLYLLGNSNTGYKNNTTGDNGSGCVFGGVALSPNHCF